ncbi:MAG: hypothetical protein FJW30_04180 [Acidobacteria bacterium]|nr:hypothetical protein [Acidobacteriota bacterium]
MSNLTSSGPCTVHLHWVRETPSRALAHPVSRSLTDLASLPAPIVEALLRQPRPEFELHLPPLFHVRDQSAVEWAARLVYRWDAAGRLVAEDPSDPAPTATMNLHQAIVLVARAATNDATPLTLAAEPGPAGVLGTFRHFESHRCQPGRSLPLRQPVRRELSLVLQRQIRAWMPALHCRTLDDFGTLRQIHALLAYSVAAPAAGMRIDEYVVDPLHQEVLTQACRRIPNHLPARLGEVCTALSSYPDAEAVAAGLSPRNATRILAGVLRQPRFLHLLFRREAELIGAVVRFFAAVHGWAGRMALNPSDAGVLREIRTSFGTVNDQLSNGFQRRSHFPLGSLALVEAARLLDSGFLLEDPVDLENAA